MKDIFEKWSEFITEEDDVRDTYDDEVEKRNKKSREQGAEKMGLEEAVAGKCQKGYITHKTQPTKKMYGNTYRNCVKAEGEEKELEEAMDPKQTEAEEIAQLEDRYLKARQRLRRSKSAPLSDPKARNEAAQILQQLTKLSKMGKYNMNNLRKKMKAAKNKNMSESLEELALQILDEKRKKKKKKEEKGEEG